MKLASFLLTTAFLLLSSVFSSAVDKPGWVAIASYGNTPEITASVGARVFTILGDKGIESSSAGTVAMTVNVREDRAAEAQQLLARASKAEGLKLDLLVRKGDRYVVVTPESVLADAARAEEQPWSEPVNGLRARLSVERDKESRFLKVFLELQNTSDVAGIKSVRFTPSAIHPDVSNENGKELARAVGPYDGLSPTWKPLTVPFEGTLRFRVSFPGIGYHPTHDNTILDLAAEQSWRIPDEGTWFLAATLHIEKKDGDHPSADWSGTLSLPKVLISQK